MKFQTPLQQGILLKRYKRFLADVRLPGGQEVTVFCPNSGSMKGLLSLGNPVWISKSQNLKRRLMYTLEIIEVEGVKVGVNTHLPNMLVEEALQEGNIIPLRGYTLLQKEIKCGKNSRLDFLLKTSGEPNTYVEVKNVTLKEGTQALFPDSITERGTKHLQELIEIVKGGERAVMLYAIQREDCQEFSIASTIDPKYGENFKKALALGVEILAYRCITNEHEIKITTQLEYKVDF